MDAIPPAHLDAIAELASRYGWEVTAEPQPLTLSVLNMNYRVETADGPVMARAHKLGMPLERLEREHQVMRWAGERGLPTNPPLPDSSGRSLHVLGEQSWAVFPWLEGRSFLRGTVTSAEATLLGATHAQTHLVLRDFPSARLHNNSELSWSLTHSIADLQAITAVIDALDTPGETLLQHRAWIARQLELLQTAELRAPADFAGLPLQPCHGDFHERNIMVDHAGNLLAVIDWERFCMSSPAKEVVRALSFARLIDTPQLERYLEGYGSITRLDPETIEPAIELWWQSSVHNTWAYREGYIRGNRAVHQFFEEGALMLDRFSDANFRASLATTIRRLAA